MFLFDRFRVDENNIEALSVPRLRIKIESKNKNIFLNNSIQSGSNLQYAYFVRFFSLAK